MLLRPSPASKDSERREKFFLHILWNESLADKVMNESIPPTEVKVSEENEKLGSLFKHKMDFQYCD